MYQYNGTAWVQYIVLQDLITGATYSNITGKITFTKYNGRHIYVSGITAGGGGTTFTGGTVIGPTIFLSGLSANTISATTYQNLPINNFITGGTFDSIFNILNLVNYTGGTVPITGFTTGSGTVFTGGTVTGPTRFLNGLSANTISATTYQNLPINNFITGGTYSSGTSTLNLVNYTGGTVSITGFTSGGGGSSNLQYYITGSTPSGTIHSGDRWFDTSSGYELVYINDGNSNQWVQPNNNGQVTVYMSTGSTSTSGDYLPLSGGTVTGATNYTAGLTANTISATTYQNLPGTSFTNCITTLFVTNISGCSPVNIVSPLNVTSGITITGNTSLSGGLTATTISATTYVNLPIDIRVTGGTYSNGTATFTNNTGGTFSVSGFSTGSSVTQGLTGITAGNGLSATTSSNVITIGFSGGSITSSTRFTNGLTANTVSATTYQNLPTDVRTTGATYSNNTFTFTNNTGGTYSVLFNTVTGLTINGNLTVTGNTSLQGLTATTISATTYVNLPTDIRVTGGTYSSGTATFTNNTGGTFSVTGFSTGNSVTQGITGITGNNGLSASTTNNVTTIGFSGGTIPNSVNFTNGLTANTISATTYQNLPTNVRTTGATYSNNTFTFTNNTGGTYSVLFNTVTGLTINGGLTVTGNTSLQGLTATTISATTYVNLPTDIRVTGGTYSSGTATFTNNTGGTFSITGFSTGNSVTQGVTGITGNNGLSASTSGNVTTIGFSGGTIPNSVNFTNGLTANTISATSYSNLTAGGSNTQVQYNKSGTFSGDSSFVWDYSGSNFNVGLTNTISGSQYSHIVGGELNQIAGNSGFTPTRNAIFGGYNNTIYNTTSSPSYLIGNVMLGGYRNSVIDNSFYNTIDGGTYNTISGAAYCVIVGGRLHSLRRDNPLGSLTYSAIIGGDSNLMNDTGTGTSNNFMGGGNSNRITNTQGSSIIGGYGNVIDSYNYTIILGGTGITATQVGTTYLENLNIHTTPLVDNTLTQVLVRDGSTGNVKYRSVNTIATGGTITGASYVNNTFTFTNNTGGTFNVLFNTVTGLTVNGNLTVTGSTTSTSFSGVSDTITGTKGSVITNGSTTTAFITVSGTNTVGGASYVDFLRVTNTTAGATNATKTIRVNNLGTIEFLNSVYTATTLNLSDNGILSVGGGNAAGSSNNDATRNYLDFRNNASQIYDDGNFHIHNRVQDSALWINTNGGVIFMGSQTTVNEGSPANGIMLGGNQSSSLIGYVTILSGKSYTTSANYGYLTTGGAGTYPGGSQTVNISLYATTRIWGQEIDAFSDERMKDIQGEIKLDEAIKLVNTLVPIKYTWKEGDDKGLKAGYSAQQVVKAGFEHLIGLIPKEGLEETIDDDGFVSPKDTQFSMNYDQVTPYHGVVIKNLLERVEELERQIKELKNSK
jgi:hypothetical protein